MELSDVITARKSNRNYIDAPIKEDDLQYLLNSARLAPSWVNKQCWRFIVIRNQETINNVSKLTAPINRWIKKAPCIILACADPTDSGHNNNQDYYLVDTAIAFEHLILAATDRGLGTCWIAGYNEEKIKTLLTIPQRIRIVAITPIGYTPESQNFKERMTSTIVRSTKRKSLEELIHYEHW